MMPSACDGYVHFPSLYRKPSEFAVHLSKRNAFPTRTNGLLRNRKQMHNICIFTK